MTARRLSIIGAALALLTVGLATTACRCESQRGRGGADAAEERDAAPGGGDGAAEAAGEAGSRADGGAGPIEAGAAGADGGEALAAGDGGPESAAPDGGEAREDAGASAPEPADGGGPGAAAHGRDASAGSPEDGPTAEASGDAGTDATDAEARRVAKLVQRTYRDARGFEADFEQTYRNRLMGRNQESSGHVWLRPPDRMRWEYDPPSKNLIVADGRHLFVYEPEPNQVVRMPVSGSELPSVMAFLTGGRDLEEDYHLRSVHQEQLEARGQAGLELRPRRPSSVIARVVLVVARSAGEVLRTVLVDPEGNTNTFVWSNVRIDRTLPDSRFTFTPPAGARLVER